MKKLGVALVILGMLSSLVLITVVLMRRPILAFYYIYRAEEENFKAGFTLRNKKSAIEERKSYFRKSCDDFSKAYYYYPQAFNFNRCEYAKESCLWVDDFVNADRFQQLQQQFKDSGGFKEADSPIVLW